MSSKSDRIASCNYRYCNQPTDDNQPTDGSQHNEAVNTDAISPNLKDFEQRMQLAAKVLSYAAKTVHLCSAQYDYAISRALHTPCSHNWTPTFQHDCPRPETCLPGGWILRNPVIYGSTTIPLCYVLVERSDYPNIPVPKARYLDGLVAQGCLFCVEGTTIKRASQDDVHGELTIIPLFFTTKKFHVQQWAPVLATLPQLHHDPDYLAWVCTRYLVWLVTKLYLIIYGIDVVQTLPPPPQCTDNSDIPPFDIFLAYLLGTYFRPEIVKNLLLEVQQSGPYTTTNPQPAAKPVGAKQSTAKSSAVKLGGAKKKPTAKDLAAKIASAKQAAAESRNAAAFENATNDIITWVEEHLDGYDMAPLMELFKETRPDFRP